MNTCVPVWSVCDRNRFMTVTSVGCGHSVAGPLVINDENKPHRYLNKMSIEGQMCAGCGKAEAKMQCPTCIKYKNTEGSYFCGQVNNLPAPHYTVIVSFFQKRLQFLVQSHVFTGLPSCLVASCPILCAAFLTLRCV